MNPDLITMINDRLESFKAVARKAYDSATNIYQRAYDGTPDGKPLTSAMTEEDLSALIDFADFFEGFRSLLD